MNIDFKLLTQQKETLLNMISRHQGENEVVEDLEGILHLLDAIEDEQEDGKKEYYFLLGEEFSKMYHESEFKELLSEAKEREWEYDLIKFIEGEHPESILESADGWMGYCSITKKEYEQLLTIKEQED